MKKTFSKRTITLIALTAVLALIYILQIIATSKTGVKTIKTEIDSEEITITKGMNSLEEIHLVKTSENQWVVGENQYPAESSTVSGFERSLKEIKLLGAVSSVTNNAERYGLDDGHKITVSSYANKKVLHTISIGKNTSTGNQCYVQLDGKNTIYLASGALHSTFDATTDSVRSKNVYSLPSSEISSVTVKTKDGLYTLQKETKDSTDDTPAKVSWNLTENTTGTNVSVSSEKVSSWLNSVSSVNVSSWDKNSSGYKKDADAVATLSVKSSSDEIEIQILEQEEVSESETKYLCASNKSKYNFYVSKYTASNINKNLEELAD